MFTYLCQKPVIEQGPGKGKGPGVPALPVPAPKHWDGSDDGTRGDRGQL